MSRVSPCIFLLHSLTQAKPLLSLGGVIEGGSTWEQEREQETTFGGKTQSTRLKEA